MLLEVEQDQNIHIHSQRIESRLGSLAADDSFAADMKGINDYTMIFRIWINVLILNFGVHTQTSLSLVKSTRASFLVVKVYGLLKTHLEPLHMNWSLDTSSNQGGPSDFFFLMRTYQKQVQLFLGILSYSTK